MPDPDVSRPAPLTYEQPSADGRLAGYLVRTLAWIGLTVGVFGTVTAAGALVTGSRYFRARIFGDAPGGLFTHGGMVLWAVAVLVLIPSSLAQLRLHRAGRLGMLIFAWLAIGATALHALERIVLLLELGAAAALGPNLPHVAIWFSSTVFEACLQAAYPVLVVLVLQSKHVRAAFRG
jgi:hypothetical protein